MYVQYEFDPPSIVRGIEIITDAHSPLEIELSYAQDSTQYHVIGTARSALNEESETGVVRPGIPDFFEFPQSSKPARFYRFRVMRSHFIHGHFDIPRAFPLSAERRRFVPK